MRRSHWAPLIAAAAIGACGGEGDRAGRTADAPGMMGHMDSGGMGHMDSGGMRGMPMRSMRMMPQMRAHMDSMPRMSPRQMEAFVGPHERRMSELMDAMGADMRGMNMPVSPEWSGLTDSVKRDLAELPDLKGQALAARMRAHAERVERLMAMHEQMMGQ